jgi:hypothetical protein
MVDPERNVEAAQGFLRIEGQGGVTAAQMRELLAVLDGAYASVSRAETFVRRELSSARAARRWARRWGPPELFLPFTGYRFGGPATIESIPVSHPLVVSRVMLSSPGFWEFLGSLNPLEVLRQYLNDRHERRKDDRFRSPAEAERLAIENASRKLDVVRQYLDLQREYADELGAVQGLQDEIVGAIRPALERLGEVDDRKLIDGPSARTSREPLDAAEH